jgi:hypothetical protein
MKATQLVLMSAYTRKQTYAVQNGVSAMGEKRTSHVIAGRFDPAQYPTTVCVPK